MCPQNVIVKLQQFDSMPNLKFQTFLTKNRPTPYQERQTNSLKLAIDDIIKCEKCQIWQMRMNIIIYIYILLFIFMYYSLNKYIFNCYCKWFLVFEELGPLLLCYM